MHRKSRRLVPNDAFLLGWLWRSHLLYEADVHDVCPSHWNRRPKRATFLATGTCQTSHCSEAHKTFWSSHAICLLDCHARKIFGSGLPVETTITNVIYMTSILLTLSSQTFHHSHHIIVYIIDCIYIIYVTYSIYIIYIVNDYILAPARTT